MKKTIIFAMVALLSLTFVYGFYIDGYEELKRVGQLVINASGSNSINFWTNENQAMIIDSSGNVGIGTNSPNAPLSTQCCGLRVG